MDGNSTTYQKNNKKRKANSMTKKSYAQANIAKIAKQVANKVVNSKFEMKRKIYDFTAVGTDPVGGSAANFSSISYGGSAIITQLGRGITQGTTDDDRIGLQITVKKIRLNFALQNADTYNNVRLLLLKNKGRYSTSSTAACLQSIMSGEASSATQWCADVDTEYWKVYLDEKIFLRSLDAAGTAIPETKIISNTIILPGNGVKLNWDTQNISPAEDFVLVAISDSAAVSHPGVTAGKCTVYYTDA